MNGLIIPERLKQPQKGDYLTDGIVQKTVNGYGEVLKDVESDMHKVCMALLSTHKSIAVNISEDDDWETDDCKAIKALERENLLARVRVMFDCRDETGSPCTRYIYLRTPLGAEAYQHGLHGRADFSRIF